MIKAKDIKDYIVWLKDSNCQSGDMQKLLPAPHMGFIKERQYWLLSNKVSLFYFLFILNLTRGNIFMLVCPPIIASQNLFNSFS